MPRNKKVTNICKVCAKPFHPNYGWDDAQFCSMDCYLSHRWGERPPQKCAHCGIDFRSKGRVQIYCSRSCANKASVGSKKPHKDGRVTKICAWCGENVTRPKSEFAHKKAFCNVHCMAEWQSEFVTGQNHPRYRGAPASRGGHGWHAARRAVIDCADGKCQKCKKPAKRIEVHHILPIRYFENFEDAHTPANLIALCVRCHRAEHKKLADALPLLDVLCHHSKTHPDLHTIPEALSSDTP